MMSTFFQSQFHHPPSSKTMTNRRLRDRTNASRPSRRSGTKASTSASTSIVSIEEAALSELSTLSAVLKQCRDDTKASLTNLVRLAYNSGASEEAFASLRCDIRAFAEQKNNSLDVLDLEVDRLRHGFGSLFGGVKKDSSRLLASQQEQQLLPEPLSVNDMFDEGILCFLSMRDISKNVAYTCKRWNRAARAEPLWKHLVKRDFMDVVAPLCQVGIVLSNPTSPEQMTYLQFAENRLKADATVTKWLSKEMKDHPAIKKLLMYKPDEIGIMSWLANNDKVKTTSEYLVTLARGVIIPEFFRRYEQVALDAYADRDKRADDYDPGEAIELPDVPQGLSARAIEYHRRARNAVAKIYLKRNGELQTYQPRFSYYSDFALFLCSTGPKMTKSEIISSLSAFDRFYDNENW